MIDYSSWYYWTENNQGTCWEDKEVVAFLKDAFRTEEAFRPEASGIRPIVFLSTHGEKVQQHPSAFRNEVALATIHLFLFDNKFVERKEETHADVRILRRVAPHSGRNATKTEHFVHERFKVGQVFSLPVTSI